VDTIVLIFFVIVVHSQTIFFIFAHLLTTVSGKKVGVVSWFARAQIILGGSGSISLIHFFFMSTLW
jgi:hypothetical protein